METLSSQTTGPALGQRRALANPKLTIDDSRPSQAVREALLRSRQSMVVICEMSLEKAVVTSYGTFRRKDA